MKKLLKVLFVLLIVLMVSFVLLLTGLKITGHILYDNAFFHQAEKGFRIPGLNDGYVPQGLTYDIENEVFLSSGYMSSKAASRIYIINEKDHTSRYVRLQNPDGTDFTGHVGGLTVWNHLIYLSDNDQILILNKEEVLNASNAAAIRLQNAVTVACQSSFNYVKGNELYVGEFYRAGNYETSATHHVTTPCGDSNKALILVYALDQQSETGFASDTPIRAYSITDLVQGMCITENGTICLSTSWGTASSHLFFYQITDAEVSNADTVIRINNMDVPLSYLDHSKLVNTLTLPPMSEEIVFVNGRIYTLYESASNKYIFGKFFRETHSWSIATN